MFKESSLIGEYVSSRSNREYTVAIAVFPIKEEEEKRQRGEEEEEEEKERRKSTCRGVWICLAEVW